jgi:uncharacterized protein YndB with AHSA1/START domain
VARLEGAPDNRITKKVWIQASADTVYRALTEAGWLSHWFCDKASCDPRAGGELLAQWHHGKARRKGRALITHLEPGRRMDLVWVDDGQGGDPPSRHTLSYEIRSKSGMTELVMIDRDDAPIDEETLAFLAEGWNSVLLELKDFCENRERAAKKRPPRGAARTDA